jgi:hypothetical protein
MVHEITMKKRLVRKRRSRRNTFHDTLEGKRARVLWGHPRSLRAGSLVHVIERKSHRCKRPGELQQFSSCASSTRVSGWPHARVLPLHTGFVGSSCICVPVFVVRGSLKGHDVAFGRCVYGRNSIGERRVPLE